MKYLDNNQLFQYIEECLQNGKTTEIAVRGTSMRPALRDLKDSVVLEPFHKDTTKVNNLDVILFKYNNRYILHRIVKIEENKIITQGDGLAYEQERCSSEDIVAKVLRIKRNNRYIECDSIIWKTYSVAWNALRPVRRYILKLIPNNI